jgi:aspartyl-tRNA synthetase
MQRRWNYKSSVDKFYDQDDLSAWAKTTGAKAGDMIFILSGPADKTRTQLSALRMELATRLGLRIPTAPLWVVDFPLEFDEEKLPRHAPPLLHQEDMHLLATNPEKYVRMPTTWY